MPQGARPRPRSGLGDAAANEFVAAANKTLLVAQQQYGQLVSSGVATPQNVGNFNTQAPYQVADAYNAAMAYALGGFAMAAQQAQDATGYIASINSNARAIQAQSNAVAAVLSGVSSSAIACASRTVIDPATGVCCDPDSCSWDTLNWNVKAGFISQTQQVANMAAQLVMLAAQALALPVPSPPTIAPGWPVALHLLPIHVQTTTTPSPHLLMLRGLGQQGSQSGYIAQAAGLPGAGSAWANVQATLQSEGQNPDQIGYAALSFVSCYQQFPLVNPQGQVGDAVSAAAAFTLGNHSYGAAVGQVADLVSAIVQGGNPNQVFQAFTGTLMSTAGLAVAAGSVSFGVGAAIIAGIDIIATIIGFNNPPQPVAMVGSCQVYGNTKPTIVDGYTWSWGNPTTVGPSDKAYWRTFPSPTDPNASGWFTPFSFTNIFSNQISWNWTFGTIHHTDVVSTCFTIPTEIGKRPIEQISSEPPQGGGPTVYRHLEAEGFLAQQVLANSPNDTMANFQLAYFAAWKANREYGLNGLQQRSDGAVLAQLVQTWNRGHNGAPVTISPSTDSPIFWGAAQPSSITPYVAILLNAQAGQIPGTDANGAVTINGFAPRLVPIVRVGGGNILRGGTSSGGGNALGSIAIGTATAVGVTAVGLAVYSYATKQKFTRVVGTLWNDTKSGASAGVRKVKGVFKKR
jgi:hypothetical protein